MIKTKAPWRRVALFFFALILQACAAPHRVFDANASQAGWERRDLVGTEFTHAVYDNGAVRNNGRLHVYLNGDGQPWVLRYFTTRDPTIDSTLALDLMQRDPHAGVLLGRPCYHGLLAPPCDVWLWTSGRFSETIVASMTAALTQIISARAATSVVLIGHSGGGTLAMLIAARVPEVTHVVTIAGLLDTDAWTRHHDYSPLSNSLNPATQPPLPASIKQLHLLGARDKNTTPAAMLPSLNRQPNITKKILHDFAHVCCWKNRWPDLLDDWLLRD
ncbi:MAG: alpha/beta hydrolase [Pseudomonadota bacterium]